MSLAAGQTLSHDEILGRLGAGAMGEVWRARDSRLGREAAIKVLPAEVASDPDRLRRFEREARALARLDERGLHVRRLARGPSVAYRGRDGVGHWTVLVS